MSAANPLLQSIFARLTGDAVLTALIPGGIVDRLDHAVAVMPQPIGQGEGVHPLNRLFARRIDRRDIDDIGIVEGVLEVLHQVAQPGEPVRLDHRESNPTLDALYRSWGFEPVGVSDRPGFVVVLMQRRVVRQAGEDGVA